MEVMIIVDGARMKHLLACLGSKIDLNAVTDDLWHPPPLLTEPPVQDKQKDQDFGELLICFVRVPKKLDIADTLMNSSNIKFTRTTEDDQGSLSVEIPGKRVKRAANKTRIQLRLGTACNGITGRQHPPAASGAELHLAPPACGRF
ncbi:hypothetical protein EVAR_19093_1 [Eumeta japonica]|uniref:Uncharacterized protein n=1 Tax=Eumeta variegata TaxID=151549 RepID=A0A4C1UQX1_EUMVA|nr:hypothetical protein EVAR_19093_1 [Eumeta japonica]